MLVLIALALSATPAEDQIVRNYMLCVRHAAVRLEPSEAPPEDVAKAAVFSCQAEETPALNIDVSQAMHLRETALFYGVGQAVAARLCRRTHDCGVVLSSTTRLSGKSSDQSVRRRLAREEGIEVACHSQAHGDPRVPRGAAEMRQQHRIFEVQQPGIDGRLTRIDVEPGRR